MKLDWQASRVVHDPDRIVVVFIRGVRFLSCQGTRAAGAYSDTLVLCI